MKSLIVLTFTLISTFTYAQNQLRRALFLGNSYTYANNLPQMVADAAISTGDTLLFDSNTPGSYTLKMHSTNAASLAKIAAGNWDYVVLQEQSQLPSLPDENVAVEVFPYARLLDSLINTQNFSPETAFYMTWGRKNGDATICPQWPPVCTYEGMDSLLNLRYRMMADSNNAIVSPVGAVWKFIRESFPQIELYQADGSHPSVAGSYAAACSFYTAFFRKDPTFITYNAGLPDADASKIRAAAKIVVYDSLAKWNIGIYESAAQVARPEGRLIAYPNPAGSTLTIQGTIPGNTVYKILTLTGKEIQAGTVNQQNKTIPVANLSRGLYLLQLFSETRLLGTLKTTVL